MGYLSLFNIIGCSWYEFTFNSMSIGVSIRQLWICPPRFVQLTKVAGVIVVS